MSAARVERFCDRFGFFRTWTAETVIDFLRSVAPDLCARLQAAATDRRILLTGELLSSAGNADLRAFVGPDDTGSLKFKQLKALIHLATSTSTCAAILWCLAVDVRALTVYTVLAYFGAVTNHTHQLPLVCAAFAGWGTNRDGTLSCLVYVCDDQPTQLSTTILFVRSPTSFVLPEAVASQLA